MYEVQIKTFFSAAHRLREYKGKCENIHGHNWKVLVKAKFRELAPNGMAYDFKDLKSAADKVVDKLDHADLNTLECFREKNPTSENIARYIFDELKSNNIPVNSVTVCETENYQAVYSEE